MIAKKHIGKKHIDSAKLIWPGPSAGGSSAGDPIQGRPTIEVIEVIGVIRVALNESEAARP